MRMTSYNRCFAKLKNRSYVSAAASRLSSDHVNI